jgi:hypothetical protein
MGCRQNQATENPEFYASTVRVAPTAVDPFPTTTATSWRRFYPRVELIPPEFCPPRPLRVKSAARWPAALSRPSATDHQYTIANGRHGMIRCPQSSRTARTVVRRYANSAGCSASNQSRLLQPTKIRRLPHIELTDTRIRSISLCCRRYMCGDDSASQATGSFRLPKVCRLCALSAFRALRFHCRSASLRLRHLQRCYPCLY